MLSFKEDHKFPALKTLEVNSPRKIPITCGVFLQVSVTGVLNLQDPRIIYVIPEKYLLQRILVFQNPQFFVVAKEKFLSPLNKLGNFCFP